MSEAAVWSVFGQRGLDDYHIRRVKATVAIPAFENTGYRGCFHDTTKVSAVVEQMHAEVYQGRRENIDNIVPHILASIKGMMAQDPVERPSAWAVYDNLEQAIDTATPPGALVNRTSHPSASVGRVLNYLRRKKEYPNTVLQGQEWLNRLHGRDQVC